MEMLPRLESENFEIPVEKGAVSPHSSVLWNPCDMEVRSSKCVSDNLSLSQRPSTCPFLWFKLR